MPITAVTYQPNATSLNAAYIPIVFRVKAKIPNATSQKYICPVVYCDVYVEGIYYKTLSRSQYISDDGVAPEYEFDIQDAIQELMDYNLPKINGYMIQGFENTIKKVFVKFRNSYTDSNGFNTSEQPQPIQGTSSMQPTAGGGTISNEIYVLNSVIQHEENQVLDKLLESYKTGTWQGKAFPLTKRPKEFKICKKDSSHFPIVSHLKPVKICVKAKMKNGEIIDLCSDIIQDCPEITNITYTVVDNGDGTQTFTFNYTLPTNLSGITGVRIYSSLDPSNGWYYEDGPTAPPRTMNLYLGTYDFKIALIGSCNMGEIIDLPGISAIGIPENSNNNPPDVAITWQDNLGTENRVCSTSTCNAFTILVGADDPDNDIVKKEVFISYDNGVTWLSFISNLTGDTFSTGSLTTIGVRLFKVTVTDSKNNSATSNILSYTKNQSLKDQYRKVITGITCDSTGGDSPTNYAVWCQGSEDFALSDSNLVNTNVGFIRLKVNGGSSEIGLSKYGGGALIINEVLPVTTLITASYGAAGQSPPSAYPWGYPANATPVIYTFEYSVDGTSGWTSFNLSVDD